MNTASIATLFGGVPIKVKLLDGTDAEFRVQQITLAGYERAFELIDDEIALTAFACGHDKTWANNLAPESYEALRSKVWEVNAKGFFVWSVRQREIVQDNLKRLDHLSPEARRMILEAGLKSASPNGSRTGLPRQR